jgi:hypothetical protein
LKHDASLVEGIDMESDKSISDDGDNLVKPGHLVILDGPKLGNDRRVLPFTYESVGRIGKQRFISIVEKMQQEGKGKVFKDPMFLGNEHALFDSRITEAI